MSRENVLRTVLAISRYTIGWVLEEQTETERRAIRDTDRGDDYLADLQQLLDHQNPDSAFEFGLHALIAGLLNPEQPLQD